MTDRAGMLKAAEICEKPKPECCGQFERDENALGEICCGRYEPGEYMDGLECAQAIRTAADALPQDGVVVPRGLAERTFAMFDSVDKQSAMTMEWCEVMLRASQEVK